MQSHRYAKQICDPAAKRGTSPKGEPKKAEGGAHEVGGFLCKVTDMRSRSVIPLRSEGRARRASQKKQKEGPTKTFGEFPAEKEEKYDLR